MDIKRYFETSETEPRLIDIISVFYFIQVITYTVDDLKGEYSIILVMMGLLFHTLAVLTWWDEKRDKSIFGSLNRLVYKVLPLGLFITYATSILELIKNGKITNSNYYNIAIFMVTALPMIMFYVSRAFELKNFAFLRQKRKGTNNLFLVVIVVMFIGQRVVNG